MSGKKLYRKRRKDYKRAMKILRNIENVVKHYDFHRKDETGGVSHKNRKFVDYGISAAERYMKSIKKGG